MSVESNPYFNRIMIRDHRDFVGRSREVEKILSRIGAARPQSVAIVGQRRLGKSSLLYHLTDREVRARQLEDPDSYLFIYVDFEGLVDLEVTDFFEVIYEEIERALGSDVIAGLDVGYRPFRRLLRRLREGNHKLILLCDEFDAVTRNPRFDPAFFSYLRMAANGYDVAYVTSAARDLQDLCHDQEVAGSPFFNIFTNMYLRPFLPEDARQLIALSEKRGLPSLVGEEGFLTRLAGYFPFLLQLACSALFDALRAGLAGQDARDAAEVEFREQAAPHIEFMVRRLDPGLQGLLHDVLSGRPLEGNPGSRLEAAGREGFILGRTGEWRLFSTLFGELLQHRQPGGEQMEATEVAEAPDEDDRVPSARFRVLDTLGMGGMGTVYRVLDMEFNEELAIKALAPDLCRDSHCVERFRNEALYARRINSTRVCRIYEFYRVDPRCWITMELVAGETLSALLKRSPDKRLPADRAVRIMREIAEGLVAAHQWLIHRDLKPSNIMIRQDGHTVIMDFGVARATGSASAPVAMGITGEGRVVGTPSYMAPEQARGEEITAVADIFGFGVLAYRMLTGRLPYRAETFSDLLKMHNAGPPQPVRDLVPEIPRGLSKVVSRCLQSNPDKRFQDAATLLTAL